MTRSGEVLTAAWQWHWSYCYNNKNALSIVLESRSGWKYQSLPIRGCRRVFRWTVGIWRWDTETFNDQVLFTAQWGHYLRPNEAAKSTKFSKQQGIHQLQNVQKKVLGPNSTNHQNDFFQELLYAAHREGVGSANSHYVRSHMWSQICSKVVPKLSQSFLKAIPKMFKRFLQILPILSKSC